MPRTQIEPKATRKTIKMMVAQFDQAVEDAIDNGVHAKIEATLIIDGLQGFDSEFQLGAGVDASVTEIPGEAVGGSAHASLNKKTTRTGNGNVSVRFSLSTET